MVTKNQRSTVPDAKGGEPPPDRSGTSVKIVFFDQRYTVANFTNMMESLEALLIVGMAQPYEMMRPKARANLANSVVIRSIHKESPLEILVDVQASVDAATSFVTLIGGILALRPLYSTAMLQGAKADRLREEERLKRRIARDIRSQYEDLSKKKRRKLLGDKKFEQLIQQAVEAALSIDRIETKDVVASDAPPPMTTFNQDEPN
jgi:hypothetical protein